MSTEEDFAAINYYCRRALHHHVYSLCNERLKRRVADPLLSFWKAASPIFDGHPTEALRALEVLQDKRDLMLACPIAIIYAHERCKLIDREAIQEQEARLTIASTLPSLSDRALSYAAMFQLHTGSIDSAKQYLKKALEINKDSAEALAFMGWADAASSQDGVATKAGTWFDRALEKNPKDLESLMGRMTILRKQKRAMSPALDITSQIIVYYPSFTPAFIERIYILLENAAWDQVLEAAHRLAGVMPDSIDATIGLCLNELCREGGYSMATSYLATLNQHLEKMEPQNALLFYTIARPFIRLSSGHSTQVRVLDECAKLLEKAIKLEPNNSSYRTEIGYVQLLLDNIPRAKEAYQHAASLDPQNVHALEGLIRCQLYNGQFEAAEEQLELYNEFQMAMGKSAEMTYLVSMLTWYKYGDGMKRIQRLNDAASMQVQLVKSLPLSFENYALVNPHFLLEMVKDYMEHCPSDPKREGEDIHPVVRTVLDLLEIACRVVPGSADGLYHLAKAKFLAGDRTSAQSSVTKCLKLDNTYAKAYVLMSQIHLANDQHKQATQFLEMGLSYNFQVRNIPLFHILKARISKWEGNHKEALDALETALDLPGMKEHIKGEKRVPRVKRPDHMPSMHERMTLYLELVDTYAKLKEVAKATKTMQEAMRIFAGMPEQDRLIIANAELAVDRGDTDAALNLLATITADQPYFIEAKKRMADIYMKYKNDKKAYARCYSELVEREPTVESCLLLGDAYMNLQEPEKAIAIYESAMDSSPEASVLASKIGKALIRNHNYARAISYYESALANDSPISSPLRYDLAELYKKLQRYDEAERVLLEAVEHEQSEDIRELELDVRCHSLLAQVFKETGRSEKAIMSLQQARDLQVHILGKESIVADNKVQQVILSDINYQIAELYSHELKDLDKASAYYNESIEHDSGKKKSSLALCAIYLHRNDLASAQQQCANILRVDEQNEEATMIMADIMYRKNSYAQAVSHFKQLLSRNPTHYTALSRLIELMRRSGNLEDAPEVISMTEKSSVKAQLHPGFHFCKGLYNRYANSPHEALKEFNFCRRDQEWGERALYHMVEIFLNPDNETVGGEALESVADASASGGSRKTDSELIAVLTADKLLKELPQNPKSLRTQVLECQAMMATKQKAEIEGAIARFMEILNAERDYVPALLGMAIGYMLLKQPPRARNQLKRIAKMEWSSDLADDFERSWILLADIYIQGGKYDLATDLLKKCLAHNKSSSKASEYLGFIMEKEASFADAAEHYENAWKLDQEANPAMGYKLAFNYLKAKKLVEAIDVCHKVLKMYPDYPKIRKDILDKARAGLRFP